MKQEDRNQELLLRLLNRILDEFGISMKDYLLNGRSRSPKYMFPRKMYCYLAKNLYNIPLIQIAKVSGLSNHATVIYHSKDHEGIISSPATTSEVRNYKNVFKSVVANFAEERTYDEMLIDEAMNQLRDIDRQKNLDLDAAIRKSRVMQKMYLDPKKCNVRTYNIVCPIRIYTEGISYSSH